MVCRKGKYQAWCLVWHCYLDFSRISSMFSSSACNKGLHHLGSAAAVSTSVFLCGSSRQILITCWQTKKGGALEKKMRNICCFLRDGGRGEKLLWAEWRDGERRECVCLLTLRQQILIMRDERYHSPRRVRNGDHQTFIASAKHNGMCEWLPVEAAPLTRHSGD